MGIKSQLYLRTGNKLSILTLTLSAPLCIWTLKNIAHQKKKKEEAKNIGIFAYYFIGYTTRHFCYVSEWTIERCFRESVHER